MTTMVWTRGQKGLLEEEAHHPTQGCLSGMINGLLQTPAYARRVGELVPHLTGDPAEHLRTRMARADQMRRLTHLNHRFILRAAVYDQGPDHPIMIEQREHLSALDEMSHIDIRVKWDEIPLHPGGFTIWRDAVWTETGETYTQLPVNLDTHQREFDRLWEESIPLADYQIPDHVL